MKVEKGRERDDWHTYNTHLTLLGSFICTQYIIRLLQVPQREKDLFCNAYVVSLLDCPRSGLGWVQLNLLPEPEPQ